MTGASSGFGKAIALACAREGAKVGLVARRRNALEEVSRTIQSNSGQALVCPTDVTDDEQIHATIATLIDNLDPIDVLVNNAGTNVTERTIADTSAAQWRQLLDVNLTSAFMFTKAIMPMMQERGDGLIVNLSSQAGLNPNAAQVLPTAVPKLVWKH